MFQDLPFMSALAAEARARLSEFDTRRLSRIVWAFAKLGYIHEPALSSISAACRSLAAQHDGPDLAITMWPWIRLELRGVSSLDSVAYEDLLRISSMGPQNLSNLAQGQSALRHKGFPMPQRIADSPIPFSTKFLSQEISNT